MVSTFIICLYFVIIRPTRLETTNGQGNEFCIPFDSASWKFFIFIVVHFNGQSSNLKSVLSVKKDDCWFPFMPTAVHLLHGSTQVMELTHDDWGSEAQAQSAYKGCCC